MTDEATSKRPQAVPRTGQDSTGAPRRLTSSLVRWFVLTSALDWHADKISPFHPASVVVLYVLVAEQLM
jgi:hypothetical protein